MKQHTVPQNIMSVEFKIVGDLTVRQFIYISIAGGLCFLVYLSFFPFILKFLLIVIFLLLGVLVTFAKINERPFDQWITNFVAAILLPTERVWRKESKVPEYLIDHTLSTTQTNNKIDATEVTGYSKVINYIHSRRLPTDDKYKPNTKMDIEEIKMMTGIDRLFVQEAQKKLVLHSQQSSGGSSNAGGYVTIDDLLGGSIGQQAQDDQTGDDTSSSPYTTIDDILGADDTPASTDNSQANTVQDTDEAVVMDSPLPSTEEAASTISSTVGLSDPAQVITPGVTFTVPQQDDIQTQPIQDDTAPQIQIPEPEEEVPEIVQPEVQKEDIQESVADDTLPWLSLPEEENNEEVMQIPVMSPVPDTIQAGQELKLESIMPEKKTVDVPDEIIIPNEVKNMQMPSPDPILKSNSLDALEQELASMAGGNLSDLQKREEIKPEEIKPNQTVILHTAPSEPVMPEVVVEPESEPQLVIPPEIPTITAPDPTIISEEPLPPVEAVEEPVVVTMPPIVEDTKEEQEEVEKMEKLEEENAELKAELAELAAAKSQEQAAPSMPPQPPANRDMKLFGHMPDFVNYPNIISGVVVDTNEKLIEDVVVIIKDRSNRIMRAMKTNILGQFYSRNPLISGLYDIEANKEGYIFDSLTVELKGQVMEPCIIRPKKFNTTNGDLSINM